MFNDGNIDNDSSNSDVTIVGKPFCTTILTSLGEATTSFEYAPVDRRSIASLMFFSGVSSVLSNVTKVLYVTKVLHDWSHTQRPGVLARSRTNAFVSGDFPEGSINYIIFWPYLANH